MDKEQLRKIIREEIKKALDQNDLFKSVHLHISLNPSEEQGHGSYRVLKDLLELHHIMLEGRVFKRLDQEFGEASDKPQS